MTLALSPGLHAAEPGPGADDGVKAEPAAAKAKRSGRGPVSVDPMQDLRERLAAKLGATRASDGKNDQELRVSTQPDGELHLAAAAQPAPKPAVKPRPAANRATGQRPIDDWSYDGESGPQAWGRLKPEFSKCASGTRQSPIDIRDGIRVDL
ncbi:MAG TPA: carbonic anhydrase family protein, partial [Burkholderiaceae bacterium]|nr:carbonic anhydrase family protein [Burkholderiaceae bacterium]